MPQKPKILYIKIGYIATITNILSRSILLFLLRGRTAPSIIHVFPERAALLKSAANIANMCQITCFLSV